MPGEREERAYAERVTAGIPVPPITIANLRKLARNLNVKFIRGVT